MLLSAPAPAAALKRDLTLAAQTLRILSISYR
jgi:hypothetical protein